MVIIYIKFIKLTKQETYSLLRLVNASSSPGWMVGIMLLDMSLKRKSPVNRPYLIINDFTVIITYKINNTGKSVIHETIVRLEC